ncbi:aa3-type cytochrome c oxidase subunit IV [Paracoccus sp. WLY502]|uniref:aa3-type cytochrome c oxidase subunit IV n=1 Tax=Paracoccus yibinensis TaxID=3068891 RepID=UPI0027968465|nr:aa3-type cytochrome c oxidase subunit IV [Paracoccus sp. WLY502]MDQ1900254.1 aa3-type cytochrome c oxidase subunit IV [Paracoccus sp. WLY502]
MAQHHNHEVTEHKVGTMDITEQQRTFAGFIKFATWTAILSILVLIFMALVNA